MPPSQFSFYVNESGSSKHLVQHLLFLKKNKNQKQKGEKWLIAVLN